MRGIDPLEEWLYWRDFNIPEENLAAYREQIQGMLDELAAYVADPPEKIDYLKIASSYWTIPDALPAPVLDRAQMLYRRVFDLGGGGNSFIQRNLLDILALSLDLDRVPFWLEILNLKKPRDTFREERINCALAALALMAVYDETLTAYRGLVQAAKTNPDALTRAQALHYLGEVHAYLENPLPEDVIDEIKPIMTEDPVFEPRFQARILLREHDVPIPLDNPGGAYAFKVKLFWDKRVYRTIELRSEQTLDELHFAIQHALHWDSDHLYSFFMNGELFDEPYGFACPYEEDRPPWTTEAVLGELGLVRKHKFLYYFDYGDGNRFEVEVVDIIPQADGEKYPRVVAGNGDIPEQYEW